MSPTCYPSSMTNIKGKHSEILSGLQSLIDAVQPFKERYFAFITANPCADIPIVPWYSVEDVEDHDYLAGLTSFSHEHYSMELSISYLNDDSDITTDNLGGIVFSAEHEYIRDGLICDDSRFFPIPYEYFTNPEAWEEEILKRVKARNELAEAVAREIFPTMPADVVKSAYYILDETMEIDVNDQEVYIESMFLIVNLNTDLLIQAGEPGNWNAYGQDKIFLNTTTGDIELNAGTGALKVVHSGLKNTFDMSEWSSRIG